MLQKETTRTALLISFFAGLLLFSSEFRWGFWPSQLVAFILHLWALKLQVSLKRRLWPLGVVFSSAYICPMLMIAGLEIPILVVALMFFIEWSVLSIVAGKLIGRGPILGPASAAAVITVTEMTLWHLVPIFGHGQCFIRPLAQAPWLIAFVAYTGMGGAVFILVFLQGLVLGLAEIRTRSRCLVWILSIVAVVATLNTVRWSRPLDNNLRVAVTGRINEPQIYEAAGKEGAQLLVTSETGLYIEDRNRQLEVFSRQAQVHGIALALGVWNAPNNDNRVWLINSKGELSGEYSKSHLIPWLENYQAGTGALAVTSLPQCEMGTMICQDDNFTDLSRSYSLKGVNLVAIPTNDWESIAVLHFENGIWRSIESGYAVARATSNGISAIISPRGEVLARLNWPPPRKPVLVGDVPLGDGQATVYAKFGDSPMFLFCLGLLGFSHQKKKTSIT